MAGGRPKTNVDEKALIKLAHIQCTNKEIAAFLNISEDALTARYTDLLAQSRETGKCSLRRAQWKKAMEGDTQMLKHLGRCMLGQRDEIALTTEEPSVRQLLNKWESQGAKRDTNNIVIK